MSDEYPIEMGEPAPAKASREVSSIAFPYMDLDDGISLARGIYNKGGVPLDRDQLASSVGQVPTSGAFQMKLSTARLFGLIDGSNNRYQLTPLGFEILDPSREHAAKAAAFLNVPLYKRAFEEFRGRQLPPRPIGLEQAFVSFGVSPKQKDKARQAFDRSARSAGFFPTPAEDRLVQPVFSSSAGEQTEERHHASTIPSMAPASTPTPKAFANVPSYIAWLIETLPPQGSEWDRQAQADWLQAVAQAFRVVFKSNPAELIDVAVKGRGGVFSEIN